MVSLYDFALKIHQDIQTFGRVGPVSDDITDADKMLNTLFAGIFEHRVEGLQICVNIP